MKENMLDVLMYIVENYTDDEEMLLSNDQDLLKTELIEAGFLSSSVNKAITWLKSHADQPNLLNTNHQGTTSFRVYLPEECDKLDVECRGFLLFLEQVGVLDATSRRVIDRAMVLDTDDFNLEQLKWVILMVLFNQPKNEATFTWMENLASYEQAGYLH